MSEATVAVALGRVIGYLRAGKMDRGQDYLEDLDFERLRHPITGRDPRQAIDPARAFGADRVRETGDYIRICLAALERRDFESALENAEAAATRWAFKAPTAGQAVAPK